jgi:hypothetical protein
MRRRRTLELGAKLRIIRTILTFVALALVAAPVLGSSVEVHCPRLPGPNRAELHARARLLLLGAGMDAARVGVDCDVSAAWLVWVDGGKTRIDETSGIVEGALDAIENRLAQARTAAPPPSPAAVPPPVSEAAPLVPSSSVAVAPERPSPRHASDKVEGGVGLGTAMEFGSASVLVGPRLDVGLAMGRKLTFVISEGARFGIGSAYLGQVMLFDLQAGVAFGAPYEQGATIGVVLLGGAERMAISAGNFSEGDAWAWSASASLGLRGSVAVGPVDAWVGVDGIARSTTIETGGPGGVAIPSVSALVSFGGFRPAFANAPPPPTSATR